MGGGVDGGGPKVDVALRRSAVASNLKEPKGRPHDKIGRGRHHDEARAVRRGVGARLLKWLLSRCAHESRPVLIGTWSSNAGGVRFYAGHGFAPVESPDEKDALLATYWFNAALGELNATDRRKEQMAASVVLRRPLR